MGRDVFSVLSSPSLKQNYCIRTYNVQFDFQEIMKRKIEQTNSQYFLLPFLQFYFQVTVLNAKTSLPMVFPTLATKYH